MGSRYTVRGSRKVDPDAAMAQAVDLLLREYRVRRRNRAKTTPQFGGGGGIPDVVIAAADTKIKTDADLTCAGLGSDEQTINQALQRMESREQAWIHLLEGTYTFSSMIAGLLNPSGGVNQVKITGAGRDVTVIRAADSMSALGLFDLAAMTSTGVFIMEDLTLDGNKTNASVNNGLHWSSAAGATVTLSRVRITNFDFRGVNAITGHIRAYGCQFDNNNEYGFFSREADSFLVSCRINNNAVAGVGSSHGGHQYIVNCVIESNGAGIKGRGLSGQSRVNVSNSHIRNNTGVGIDLDDTVNTTHVIVANFITDNGGAAVEVAPGGSIVQHNFRSGNGPGGTTESAHITDHGDLTGLADDDHTQYLLADGSRSAALLDITGNLDVGGDIDAVGHVGAEHVAVDGLTGAVAASRYVGATASGAPASGTFAVGDYVITQDGEIYICTTAGTPGTWAAVGAAAATDTDAIHVNEANEIHGIAEKTITHDDDEVVIEDSNASWAKKRVKLSNLPGGGGGSGGTVPAWMEALAVRPTTTHAADDEFDDDSIAAAWSQIAPATGTITATESLGIMSVAAINQAANDGAGVVKSMGALSAPVTIETAVRSAVIHARTFGMVGLVFADGTAAGSNIFTLVHRWDNGRWRIEGGTWGTTAQVAEPADETTRGIGPLLYMRLIWKSANTWAVAVSPDGVTWSRVQFAASYARTMTPTHFGLFVTSFSGTTSAVIGSYEYFRVTESDLSV